MKFSAGDMVAWTTMFNQTFAGEVVFVGFTTLLVKRVDGGQCTVEIDRVHLATPDEILAACDVFTAAA